MKVTHQDRIMWLALRTHAWGNSLPRDVRVPPRIIHLLVDEMLQAGLWSSDMPKQDILGLMPSLMRLAQDVRDAEAA